MAEISMRLFWLALLVPLLLAAGCRHSYYYLSANELSQVEALTLPRGQKTREVQPTDSVAPDEVEDGRDSRDGDQMELKDPTVKEANPFAELIEAAAAAENGVPLSLQEARALALQYNLGLRAVRISRSIADQRVREEEWRFEATFSGVVARQRTDPPPSATLLPAAGSASTLDNSELFLAKPLRTGGAVEIGRSTIRFDVFAPASERSALAPTLRVSQPLLRDAGFAFNTAPILLARLDGRVSQQAVRAAAIRVAGEVEQLYWRVYEAREGAKIERDNLEFARRQVELSTQLAEAELVPRADILRAESRFFLTRDGVIQAELRERLASRGLKRVMQAPFLPPDGQRPIIPTTEPAPVGLQFDRQELTALALRNRPEINQLELLYSQASIQRQVAKNQSLPRLDFAWQGRRLGEGDSDRLARLQAYNDGFFDTRATLEMDLPILGNQSARARWGQARLAERRSWVELQDQRWAVEREVQDSLDLLDQNWQRIEALKLAVRAAARTYAAEVVAYEEGQRTSDLVLLSATQLTFARSLLNNAITEYHVAAANLAIATGTMLGYADIELESE